MQETVLSSQARAASQANDARADDGTGDGADRKQVVGKSQESDVMLLAENCVDSGTMAEM